MGILRLTVDGVSEIRGGRARALVIASAGLLPWVVIPYDSGASLVFSFGLVSPGTLDVTSVVRYAVGTRGLPPSLLAWPLAALLYALGLGSWAFAYFDREDRRVTAGLFALAGLDLLYFAVAFTETRIGVFAIPAGTGLLWIAAWVSRPVELW